MSLTLRFRIVVNDVSQLSSRTIEMIRAFGISPDKCSWRYDASPRGVTRVPEGVHVTEWAVDVVVEVVL